LKKYWRIEDVLEILTYPDPVLRKKADDVETITDEYHQLIEEMAEAMYDDDGVGLAAPQVGVSKRVIVVDGGEGFMALFNPEIIKTGDDTDTVEEGCLSLPGIRVQVERPTQITLRALNVKGETVQLEIEGLVARIFQHEIDHLNGILIIDRVSSINRSLLKSKLRKLEKEALRS